MTNERAVEILNLDLDILGQYGGETAEAYKMAIKVLDAQPCEDCISREEAINEADNLSLETSYDNEKVEQMLRDLPPVTPQASKEDIHREREQAYMLGYEDASKKFRTESCEDCRNCKKWNKCPCGKEGHENGTSIGYSIGECKDYESCEDCISRQAVDDAIYDYSRSCDVNYEQIMEFIDKLPSVKPKYTDEEIDKAQAVEQAYVDKMVELAVEESRREWLESFDTSSATKCFEAVNLLKQRLEGEE